MTGHQNAEGSKTEDATRIAAEENSRITRTLEIHEDAHGFTYHSVRFCDLNRISDK